MFGEATFYESDDEKPALAAVGDEDEAPLPERSSRAKLVFRIMIRCRTSWRDPITGNQDHKREGHLLNPPP